VIRKRPGRAAHHKWAADARLLPSAPKGRGA
jgi:hypothetical protein